MGGSFNYEASRGSCTPITRLNPAPPRWPQLPLTQRGDARAKHCSRNLLILRQAVQRAVMGGHALDIAPCRVDAQQMEDDLPRKREDPAAALARQDLDPLSVAELEARIALLEREIIRCRESLTRAVNHRASADALFKR